MITGRSARMELSLLVVTVMVAAGAAPALASSPAGTAAWRDQTATRTGAFRAPSMSITLALFPRHAAKLDSLVATPHAALEPAQFDSEFAPSIATIKTIKTWAKASHLRTGAVAPNRMLVRLSGSSTAIARALTTSFSSFQSPRDGSFFAATKAARLPRSFASRVSAVLGLSSLAKVVVPKPAVRSTSGLDIGSGALPKLGLTLPSLSYPATYGPRNFWSIYDAPAAQTGSGQQLSIIAEGDLSQPRKDLATFERQFKLPAVTWNQINVGTPTTDTTGNDEWDLDSQYSTGFAPGVTKLDVYVGPSLSNQDILTTINRWVTDNASRQGSFSAGECDLLAYVSGFTSGLDAVLKQANAQGQTMFFSSGDTGSQCPAIAGVNGVPVGAADTNYPASSPNGIGVGGTSVLSPTGPSEITWYAGGGGLSPIEATPAFQSSTKLLGVTALVNRGVPDVSLDADPESGYQVVVNGAQQTIGGTSASAPSWQGIWARAQAAHGGTLGFAGPVLYKTEPATAFHDITLGSNGLYAAHPGYDLTTGLGTPDIAKLINGA